MKKQSILFAGLMSVSPLLWAHSGDVEHHGFWATVWHVVTQPDHLLGIVSGSVIALAAIAAGLKIRRRIRQAKTVSLLR